MKESNMFKNILIIGFSVILAVLVWFLSEEKRSQQLPGLIRETYALWDMDDISDNGVILDQKGGHNAVGSNVKLTKGFRGKALYFNGKDSSIKTPISINGWEGFTIALCVKPQRKGTGDLSVILDNGHAASTDFVIQSSDINDPDGLRWVFRCSGADIPLILPPDHWSQVIITADTARGEIEAFVNGISSERKMIKSGFKFGDTPLVIGKLAGSDSRYFKGVIDDVVVLKRAITEEEVEGR